MDQPDSDILYEGWMVKSPPQKRSSHGYPLIKKKWRRRWFVLEQGKLPAQYLLCYYTDEHKRRLKGTICLDECDQVDIGLKDENGKYDFMFNIRTPKRIYFLAVDTQEEMKTWARMVCDACGLRSAPDDEEENDRPSSAPLAAASDSSTTRPRVATSSSTAANHQLQQQPQISSPYIHISECYTGVRPPPKQQQQQNADSLKPGFHIRSLSSDNGDARGGLGAVLTSGNGRRTGGASPSNGVMTAMQSHSFHVDDDEEDDSVFEDMISPPQAGPRPPPWSATPRLSVTEEVMMSSLKLGHPPDRPPKPPHLAHQSSGPTPSGITGFENYANSSDMQEVYRLESNNNLSSSASTTPSVSRDLKPGRKVQGSVTMAAAGHSAASGHQMSNFSTMGPPVERAHKPRPSALSTMPRLAQSSFGSASKQPSTTFNPFHSRDTTSSPDDWLNTDDVAARGNGSDDEQIYFYMPPMNTTSSYGGSSLPLMIPADSFEHPSVSYIDLDLPCTDESDNLSVPTKPAPVPDHSSTIYKTIDIAKTDAFNRTKQDREKQRHKNDKS